MYRCPEYAKFVKRQLGGDRGSVSSGLNLLGRDRGSQGSGLDSLGGQQGLMQEPASLEMGIAWSTDGVTGAPVGKGGLLVQEANSITHFLLSVSITQRIIAQRV